MKKQTLVAIIAIAILAFIAVLTILVKQNNPVDEIAEEIKQHNGENPAVTETIAAKVPENAVFMASSTDVENMNEWWKFFSKLNYYDPALPTDLNEELVPQELIYAAFPYEDEEGNFAIADALYVRIDGESTDFYEWLIQERLTALEERNDPALDEVEEGQFPTIYSLPVIAHDDFIVIPSNGFAYNEITELIYDGSGEEVEVEGLTAHEDWEDISKINDSVLWFNADGYVNFFLDNAPEEETKEATLELLTLTAGYETKTTFLGTSKDYGKTWSGVFPTGGLDPSLVDLEAAERKIMDSVYFPETSGEFIEGLLPFSSVISSSNKVGDEGNIQTFGEVRPTQVNHPVTALVADEDFRTSVAFSPQLWSQLFRGITEYESVAYVTLDITENNSARLSFTFYDELEDLTDENADVSETEQEPEAEAAASQ